MNNKINELKIKFEKARTTLSSLNGVDMSYMEQTEYYNSLINEYKLKVDLLNHYKEISSFELAPIPQVGALDLNSVNTDNVLESDNPVDGEANIVPIEASSIENFEKLEPIVPKEEIETQIQNGSFDVSFE